MYIYFTVHSYNIKMGTISSVTYEINIFLTFCYFRSVIENKIRWGDEKCIRGGTVILDLLYRCKKHKRILGHYWIIEYIDNL